jgi:Flp pilus assembly protein TadG
VIVIIEPKCQRKEGSAPRGQGLPAVRRGIRAVTNETGQAATEFALVLTLFLVLVFAVILFGMALNTADDATHLADEAARYAAVNFDPGTGGQSLVAWVKAQGDTTYSRNSTICISFPNGTSNIGDPVKIVVTSSVLNWKPMTSWLKQVGFPSTVQGQATMRLEATPTVYGVGCA